MTTAHIDNIAQEFNKDLVAGNVKKTMDGYSATKRDMYFVPVEALSIMDDFNDHSDRSKRMVPKNTARTSDRFFAKRAELFAMTRQNCGVSFRGGSDRRADDRESLDKRRP